MMLMTRLSRAAAWFQGRPYVDGSLQDFVLWRNSEKLTCGGSAFIVDYSQVRPAVLLSALQAPR